MAATISSSLTARVREPRGGQLTKKKVLFICTNNSARSQMAEGLLNTLYGNRYDAYSAGLEPTEVNAYAIKIMAEINIDISKQRSKSIAKFHGKSFDYVVTVCNHAKEVCPIFPGGKAFLHKGFKDPSELKGTENEILAKMRCVRDEIRIGYRNRLVQKMKSEALGEPVLHRMSFE